MNWGKEVIGGGSEVKSNTRLRSENDVTSANESRWKLIADK